MFGSSLVAVTTHFEYWHMVQSPPGGAAVDVNDDHVQLPSAGGKECGRLPGMLWNMWRAGGLRDTESQFDNLMPVFVECRR